MAYKNIFTANFFAHHMMIDVAQQSRNKIHYFSKQSFCSSKISMNTSLFSAHSISMSSLVVLLNCYEMFPPSFCVLQQRLTQKRLWHFVHFLLRHKMIALSLAAVYKIVELIPHRSLGSYHIYCRSTPMLSLRCLSLYSLQHPLPTGKDDQTCTDLRHCKTVGSLQRHDSSLKSVFWIAPIHTCQIAVPANMCGNIKVHGSL